MMLTVVFYRCPLSIWRSSCSKSDDSLAVNRKWVLNHAKYFCIYQHKYVPFVIHVISGFLDVKVNIHFWNKYHLLTFLKNENLIA